MSIENTDTAKLLQNKEFVKGVLEAVSVVSGGVFGTWIGNKVSFHPLVTCILAALIVLIVWEYLLFQE